MRSMCTCVNVINATRAYVLGCAGFRKKIFDKCCQRANGEMRAYENFHSLCRTKSRFDQFGQDWHIVSHFCTHAFHLYKPSAAFVIALPFESGRCR